MRRLRIAAVASAAALLTTSCVGGSTSSDGTPRAGGALVSQVEVATPELRAAKKAAGIERCEPGEDTPVEGGLPDVVLACLGGGPDVDLSTLRGPMVLNLWAQWCGPCREELPYYQQLHERAGDKVDVVGVDYQDTLPGKAIQLADEAGVTYPLLADPGAQIRVPLRVRGLPGVVFVDADGKVVHTEYVVIESYAQLQQLVEEHLGVTV